VAGRDSARSSSETTLRELLAERDFSAAVAWARGGGTQDGYADVLYLTGFFTHQPYVPGRAGRWRATGHAAVVMPAAGPVTAVVDSESLRQDLTEALARSGRLSALREALR
jgi:hypothetical protein